MSKEIVPEWLRLKREIQSLMRSLWHEIGRLTDRVDKHEKRLDRLEQDVQSSGRMRFYKRQK